MKFISLHTRNTTIIYKNALCSSATLVVLAFIVLSVMIPVLLVSLLSPNAGISDNQVLYEQPQVSFKFQSLFMAETIDTTSPDGVEEENLVACSTFPYFNQRTEEFQKSCQNTKFWSEDVNYDHQMDRANFQLELDAFPGMMRSFELILFFDARLKHKCSLSPPAILTHHLDFPKPNGFSGGTVIVKGHLKLMQYVDFICPFYGGDTKTTFRHTILAHNTTGPMEQFQLETIRKEFKSNPAHFDLEITETYYKQSSDRSLKIQLSVDIIQVPARYRLSAWEHLGQFWLYFASFFGISFYIMNKTKDFLFGRHIIRSWEIIPWKKLY